MVIIQYLLITSIFAGDTINYAVDSTSTKSAIVIKSKEISGTSQNNLISAFMEKPYVIHISVTGNFSNITARVYDLLGKEVQRNNFTKIRNFTWILDNTLKGVYLLKVQTENTSLVKKIILY